MARARKFAGIALPAALGLGVTYLLARIGLSVPRTGGRMKLPCLDDSVEVIYDAAGIPHITAKNGRDAFRALGYVMAQDRMVQMETMLRVASGTLCEVAGPMALDMDRFMRTIGIARLGKAYVDRLDDESRDCLDSYCEGINAYLSRRSIRLPFEFMFLKGKPEHWSPSDSITLGIFTTWLLDSMWPADLMREKLVRALGWERARELLPETSKENNPPVKVKGSGGPVADPLDPGEEIDWDFAGEAGGGSWSCAAGPAAGYGSNNWAIGGEKTTTGKPILACDPHIQHNAPGMIYLCHVTTPDYDVIGGAFPGIPVIVYGHNGYCGWGATSLCPDVQDLYVETFESEKSDRYLYRDEWIDAEVVEEEVKVRFAKPRKLRIVITRHGPVIKRKGDKGLALRWVGNEVASDSLSALLRQNRARSWDEFTGAMEGFVGPAMNEVYADVDGNIGYMAAAKVPIRAEGDGSIPLNGAAGEGEWEGCIPFEEMPRTLNPREGFLATANSKAVSGGYPWLITTAWEAPYRNARISELIRSGNEFSVDDMPRIHGDCFTFPGKRFARMAVAASEAVETSLMAREAVELLGDWDHQARADSPAMSIYFYSWDRLREKLLRHRLGSTLFEEYTCGWTTVNPAIEGLLERRDPYWLPPGCESYDQLVIDALEEGVGELEGIFQSGDQSTWRWGRIHYLVCQSLLGVAWPLDRIFNVGPVPRDGEGDTVNAAPPASDCLSQLLARGTMGGCTEMALLPDRESHAAYGGPVLRMVLDMDDLDNSRAVLDVGQSGHRLSPHYRDHFPLWEKVEYFPLPYSRDKVLELSRSRLELFPGS